MISAPVIAFAVIGGFLGNVMARADDTYAHLRVFQDVVSLIMSNYVEQPNLDNVMRGAMRGLAESLDSDSAFLTAPQVRQVEGGDQPGPADVGIVLTHQYYLRVVSAQRRLARRQGRHPPRRFRAASSTRGPRATCRRSKASACCTARRARR